MGDRNVCTCCACKERSLGSPRGCHSRGGPQLPIETSAEARCLGFFVPRLARTVDLARDLQSTTGKRTRKLM